MIQNFTIIKLTSITQLLEELGSLILSTLPNIAISIIVILGGYLFVRLSRIFLENRFKNQRLGEHLRYTLYTLIRWTTILIVTSIVLLQFGLNIAAITGFLSIIGGTVIGFAAINTLGNAIAGFIIMLSRPFRVGDRIFFNDRFSDVITINLIYTKLRTPNLVYVNVPNQELIRKEVDNYGKKNIVRQSVTITAGYDESRKFITRILLDCVRRVPLVLKAPLPFVRITDFQNYAMEYTLFYFISNVKRMPWIEGLVRESIVDAFIEHGIDLTTPLISMRPNENISSKNIVRENISVVDVKASGLQSIRVIEGIGEVYSDRLSSVYINTVDELLEAGSTREGRLDLAEKTGISVNYLLKWINIADLMRVDGVGKEYSQLLEGAGVDTVVDLARRNPRNLYNRLKGEDLMRNLTEPAPSFEMVETWVEEAKKLPRKITY